TQRGLLRFNLLDNTTTRFASTAEFIDVTVGRNGLVDGLKATSGAVTVYDPVTLAQVGSVNLPFSPNGTSANYRGLAVNAAGEIYAATWEARVLKFDPSGALLGSVTLTRPGSGPSFYNPMDIDLSADGTLALGTWSGHIVQLTEA